MLENEDEDRVETETNTKKLFRNAHILGSHSEDNTDSEELESTQGILDCAVSYASYTEESDDEGQDFDFVLRESSEIIQDGDEGVIDNSAPRIQLKGLPESVNDDLAFSYGRLARNERKKDIV